MQMSICTIQLHQWSVLRGLLWCCRWRCKGLDFNFLMVFDCASLFLFAYSKFIQTRILKFGNAFNLIVALGKGSPWWIYCMPWFCCWCPCPPHFFMVMFFVEFDSAKFSWFSWWILLCVLMVDSRLLWVSLHNYSFSLRSCCVPFESTSSTMLMSVCGFKVFLCGLFLILHISFSIVVIIG